MKKYGLLIICLMMFIGGFAQQSYSAQKEYTQHINTVIQKNDPIVTTVIDHPKYPLAEYEAMVKRCNELASQLVKHEKRYHSGVMTKKEKKAWKRDIVEAKLLNFRIEDFTAVYLKGDQPIVEYINIQVLNNFEDFSKTLEVSDKYAGF